MIPRRINVDFSKRNGKIKAITGAVGGVRCGAALGLDFSKEYAGAGIPLVRVRNAQFPYGSNQYVDVHCIFPDLTRDACDESAYNFAPTDAYFKAISDTGAKIFLCLGESEEPFENKLCVGAPCDLEKWASVCEYIVAHYNEGWANGYKLGIKYCEIFPGADSPESFGGTAEEYLELYRVAANRLKERFPKLKVGAYSSCGFKSLNHFDATENERSYVDYLCAFLSGITEKGREAPLDFLTWKCITDSPEELSLHSSYARSYLSQYGLKKAESIVSEFNLDAAYRGEAIWRREYPAELASSYIIAQKSGIDKMFYSDLYPYSCRNAVFTVDDAKNKRLYAAYEVLCCFGEMYRQGTCYEVSEDSRRELYSLASADKFGASVLVAARGFSGTLEIAIRNSPFSHYSIKGILGGGERGEGFSTERKGIPLDDGIIAIRAGSFEVYFITLY